MFEQKSYDRHQEWYNRHFPTTENKVSYFHDKRTAIKDSIAIWLQQLFFNCLDPLLKEPGGSWLTIGDAYGFDAQYIQSGNSSALASDLNADFLEVARQQGIIQNYTTENAEKLSFAADSFDYVLCKESYHHFPRPYAALYEMIRVSKKGIVIIEPQDPVTKMPLLLMLTNLLKGKPKLRNKVWKNEFSFEPVGNFVYKVSEREFEKFAAGLNLPLVAFKKINPNFYFKGADHISAATNNRKFLTLKAKKWVLDLLVKLRLFPAQVLSAIIFKELPDGQTIKHLKENGYHLVYIPENPYL